MKVKFKIIEVIAQDFEMEFKDDANVNEEITKLYRDGKLVVDNAVLIQADVLIDNGKENNESTMIYS